ncbi:MAG: serine hydrolase [Marinicella sp.]
MKKIFITAIWLINSLLYLSVSNATNKTEEIDLFIKERMNQFTEIPGLAIAIVQGDKKIFQGTYGIANQISKEKLTPDTSFYIASVTKSYMALLATLLDEQDKLSLDKNISELAPIKSLKNRKIFDGITVRDLITHQSGLRNAAITWRFASGDSMTRDEMINLLENNTSHESTTKSFRYDNLGYNILEIILREEFKLNWKRALEEELLDVIGLNETTGLWKKAQTMTLAAPHVAINDQRSPEISNATKTESTFHSAGGMVSSITDMADWLLLNINKGKLRGKNYFPASMFERSHQQLAETRGNTGPFKNSGYAMGWFTGHLGEEDALYHNGGYDGFFSHVSWLPKHNLGVVILVNESHFGDNIGLLIADYVYSTLLNEMVDESIFENKVSDLQKKVDGIQTAFRQDRERRKSRTWKSSIPISSWAGKFYNKQMGELEITYNTENELVAKLGISEVVATPSSLEDALRVEFRDGNGEDVIVIHDTHQASAVVYSGKVFYRIES